MPLRRPGFGAAGIAQGTIDLVRALLTVALYRPSCSCGRCLPPRRSRGSAAASSRRSPKTTSTRCRSSATGLPKGCLGGLVEAFTAGPGVIDLAQALRSLPASCATALPTISPQLEQTFGTDPSHIAIVMLGAQDRYSIGRAARIRAENDDWRGEYAARVDRLMKLLQEGQSRRLLGRACRTCAAGRTTSARSA